MELEKRLNVVDLGLMRYGDALDEQNRLADARLRDEIDDTLLFVEHPPVITMGVKAQDGEIRLSSEHLASLGIEVFRISRGGFSFLHNPGQVVAYPIRLADPDSKRNYMTLLQQTMIEVAQEYGVDAVAHPRRAYVGAWFPVDGGLYHKIGAIGVHYKSGNGKHVTMHGLAFNVNNDMSIFSSIRMCGLRFETCISLKAILEYELPLEDVKTRLLANIVKKLGYSSVHSYASPDELLQGGVIA